VEREADEIVVLQTSTSLILDLEMQETEEMLLLAVPLEGRGVVQAATEDLLIPVSPFSMSIIGMSADEKEKEVRQMEEVSTRSTTGESCFFGVSRRRRGD
jgi:hypothetical protein